MYAVYRTFGEAKDETTAERNVIMMDMDNVKKDFY
jgi:hypothetical protein